MARFGAAAAERAMKNIDYRLFYLIQWTWGLPVNLIGALCFLFCKLRGYKSENFGYAHITYVPWNAGGISIGTFIFIRADHPSKTWTYNARIHEYGHTWQCLLLGPLYLLVIGIPSSVWCNFFAGWRKKNNVSYYVLYTENWANSWGQKYSGMEMIRINGKIA